MNPSKSIGGSCWLSTSAGNFRVSGVLVNLRLCHSPCKRTATPNQSGVSILRRFALLKCGMYWGISSNLLDIFSRSGRYARVARIRQVKNGKFDQEFIVLQRTALYGMHRIVWKDASVRNPIPPSNNYVTR